MPFKDPIDRQAYEQRDDRKAAKNQAVKNDRSSPILNKRARFIIQDSNKSDKRHGRLSDLDREFVTKLLERGCSYCGIAAAKIKMTVDRLDNSIGHLKSNVVPACIRCNDIRGDMPLQIWLRLVPTIKQLQSEGAFDNWIPNSRNLGSVV